MYIHNPPPPPPPQKKKKKQPTKKHALTSAKGSGQGGSADVLKLPGQQESGYVMTLGLTPSWRNCSLHNTPTEGGKEGEREGGREGK